MARSIIKYLYLITPFLTALLILSCSGRKDGIPQQKQPPSVASEELRTDSFKYSLENEYGSCEVYIDYPVSGPKAAVSAIRHFIITQLLKDQTQGVPEDPVEMAKTYCERTTEKFKATLDQMGLPPPERSEAPEDGLEIRFIDGTSKWATYEVFHYSYLTGGGHGEYTQYGTTFRLSDGRRLSYNDILVPVNEYIYKLLREGMMQYFEVSTDRELESICNVDLSLMPLPTYPPYLTSEGIGFHYSIYDICPFDWGDPSFVVPYEKIRPYLKSMAWDLVY